MNPPPRLPLGLEVRDCRLVRAVADHGNLTRAGGDLHLTQSALSHQLAALERRLGAPLFVRLGRRMVLTPLGESFLTGANAVLAAVRRAEDGAIVAAEQRVGMIRLATECYTCYHWLPPILRVYAALAPRVETRIVADATRRPLAALLDGELDVAIVRLPVRDRRLRVTPLFTDEILALVSPGHPWAARPYVVAEDFAQEHYIGYTVTPAESHFFQELFVPAGVAPRQVSAIQLTEAIVELVKGGVGVAALARWAVEPHVREGTLCAVRITKAGLWREWGAVRRAARGAPKHVTTFVDVLRAQLARGPAGVAARLVSALPIHQARERRRSAAIV
jgi:LysR family transcriptional regulator for metE and metH